MTRLIIVYLIALSCQLCGQEAAGDSIRDRMRQQEAAWNKGDLPGFMACYWKSDSLQFIGSRGVTYGWQKVYDNYKKSYPDRQAMGELTFELLQLRRLADDTFYVVGKWSLKKDKPAGGYFSLIWKRISGAWLIVSDHTS